MAALQVQAPCDHVAIAFASDDAYMMPTAVAIESLLESSRQSTSLDIAILIPSRISTEHVDKISSLQERYPNSRISWLNMGELFQDPRQRMGRISYPACYRLMLPSLFPDRDKIIYADSDVIFEEDLSALMAVDLDTNYLGAVRHPGYYLDNCRDLEHDIGVDRRMYFNSGVLLCNLKRLRQEAVEQRLLEDLECAYRRPDSERFESLDQDILNRICSGRVHYLPFRYNVIIRCAKFNNHPKLAELYDPGEFKRSFERPAVIHYADRFKPWNTFFLPFRERWDKYFYRSPYADGPLDRKDLEHLMAGEWYRLFQGDRSDRLRFIARKLLRRLHLLERGRSVRRALRGN